MVLRLPSEVIADKFMPTVRAMLAEELSEHDYTQKEIAERLGITQAAVSNHLNGRTAQEERVLNHPDVQKTVKEIAEGFQADDLNQIDALAELLVLVHDQRAGGVICDLHQEAVPELQDHDCDLCLHGNTSSSILARRDALQSVERSAYRLSSCPHLQSFIPAVGTNIGTALKGATDITDVAAIPGRIKQVGGKVQVPAEPEFGASVNVAEAILAANSVNSDIRGGLNLRTDEQLVKVAQDRGITVHEFEAEKENRSGMREIFEQLGEVPKVCYHRGKFGMEPILFIFGETAMEAADLTVTLTTEVVHRISD